MSLKLYPYNPDQSKEKSREAVEKLSIEWASQAYEGPPKDPDAIEMMRRYRKRWYANGGKEICAKNNRDRIARLKKKGKL